ncbi:hypothetical protein [Moellerella wisconsensis]|uniref:Uncharacterized protein n=1 Tax=Moellerella wisconsensis TaxID=158849 RepID=A0A9Q8V4L7_9GAMM|nr:hypothetical protein [Moellerella wisconsensis]UNH31352.1 hypothetical protein MNY72_03250 [Moellerella wisconsensis]
MPTIDEASEQKSEEEYIKFMSSLNQEQKQRIFPDNQIPAISRTKFNIAKCITSHFMGNSYMPVLLNQVLHEVNANKTPQRNTARNNFTYDMATQGDILPACREKNEFLLVLEDAINQALSISSSEQEGLLALSGFEEQAIEIQTQ